MQTADAPQHPPPPASRTGVGQASILSRAVTGAFWTILSGTGARIFGILGTLAITHYLSPEEYGEVSLAALAALTATTIANAGISNYIASQSQADRAAIFHATFYYLLLGVVALGLALLFGGPFSYLVSAPGIGKYLPLLAASTFVDRICTIQDRIQVRDMRFRTVGLIRSLGELVYATTSVLLAATCAGTMFGGAYALVWAMMARSLVRLVALTTTTPWREWAEPHRLTARHTRAFFAYGLPMSMAGIANFGSSKFDNFVYSHHFGEAAVGKYNATYNFADMPAALIAETVGDVLVPSFAKMESDDSRRESFLMALRTLVLLVTPLSLGLVVVAPELVRFALSAEYEGSIPILRILALLAVPRTIIWTAISYMQVRKDPRLIMILEWGRMFGIVILMHVITVVTRVTLGPQAAVHAACTAVVLVFTLSSLSYMVVLRRIDGVPLLGQILPLLPPALACVPMVLAVLAVQHVLPRIGIFTSDQPLRTFAERAVAFGPRLLIEVVVGAVVFVPSALALAPVASRHLLRMVGASRARRPGGAAAEAS